MRDIKISKNSNCYCIVSYIIVFCLLIIHPTQTFAEEIKRHGDAYVIYLSGDLNFNDVVASVESEILGENWQVVDDLDIGAAVKEFGRDTDNRVLSVCKLQYLAQSVEEDPFISLIIPCRFTIFRESASENKKGKIVVGFYDPVAEAEGLDLKQAQAAAKATEELKAVLHRVAEIYK